MDEKGNKNLRKKKENGITEDIGKLIIPVPKGKLGGQMTKMERRL